MRKFNLWKENNFSIKIMNETLVATYGEEYKEELVVEGWKRQNSF